MLKLVRYASAALASCDWKSLMLLLHQ
jgi:hypothetical protein